MEGHLLQRKALCCSTRPWESGCGGWRRGISQRTTFAGTSGSRTFIGVRLSVARPCGREGALCAVPRPAWNPGTTTHGIRKAGRPTIPGPDVRAPPQPLEQVPHAPMDLSEAAKSRFSRRACPDHQRRQRICKRGIAALLQLSRIHIPEPTRPY